MADELTRVRIAENQSTFRSANEKIEGAADEIGVDLIPFICECPDPECTEIVRLERAVYDDVRRNPRRFFTMPGRHEVTAVTTGAGIVFERHEGYVVVDKIGVAGDVAAERAGDHG